MLSPEENSMLTRVGPGTPAGGFLRCYWQPAALSEDFPTGGAPQPVRLLGEDLVLFRDEEGQPGLLGIHCAHRGADLSYGRIEAGGLRCIYHGWLYDVDGRCVEQPGEPVGSTFHERIRQRSYPCLDVGGLILCYMGLGEPPLLPAYEFLAVPPDQARTSKVLQECNYQQGGEGNIDPVHHSFLHLRFGRSEDDRMSFYGQDPTPTIDPEETDFGVRVYAVRRLAEGRNYVKITNFILPSLYAVTGDANGYSINWHVPIDDVTHWKYQVVFRRNSAPPRRDGGSRSATGYLAVRNRGNRYMQDRDEMKAKTFSGLGMDFQAEDGCVTEGSGPIQDRAKENAAYTDRAIVAARAVLLRGIRAVQSGAEAPHVVREPALNHFPNIGAAKDVIPSEIPWRGYWENETALRENLIAHV
ncbi:MAG: phthalate 4,5-dioxygenase [Chloroflexi bacterium]|nr:phthalate 4,5-dioxygenase [Chloroflexota bacterium]